MIESSQAKAFRYRSMPAGHVGDVPGRAAGYMTDPEWLDMQTLGFPVVWQEAIRGEWAKKHGVAEQQRREANQIVVKTVRELADAQRAGLRLDSTDEQIRARARVFARHYADGIAGGQRVKTVVGRSERRPSAGTELVGPKRSAAGTAIDAAIWEAGYSVGAEVEGPQSPALWARREMERHGMGDHWPQLLKKCSVEAALARVRCEIFWRRVLRKVFAKTVEACSIGLGLVNKERDCYVSALSVARRRQQNARNAASLERTELENEYGQRMKLADLAAKSTANKAVRRAELMTRISGFDVIAKDCGDEATFITVTCPSRMHKWTDRGHEVAPNTKFDGTTPGEAQAYLSGQWARCRAALKRAGVEVYGFRVAEPHHDGCPHWHLLLFHAPAVAGKLREVMLRYFLENDSPTERGAAEHRVKFERIDRTKGSAAAYLAKYIAKNIDGYQVGTDLYGAPAVESSQRVDAWAATWRIRQFQQLGGAPVTVWRELRRVNPDAMPEGVLPKELTDAMSAVNIGQTGALWAQGWAAYTRAQGGPCVHRMRRPIKLLRKETGEVNRYHEVREADVIGIECHGRNWFKPAHMVAMFGAEKTSPIPRPAAARIESERAQWRVVGEGGALPLGEAGRPWTRVNNCTRTLIDTGNGARSVAIVQRSKLGRWRPIARPEAAPGGFPASTGVVT